MYLFIYVGAVGIKIPSSSQEGVEKQSSYTSLETQAARCLKILPVQQVGLFLLKKGVKKIKALTVRLAHIGVVTNPLLERGDLGAYRLSRHIWSCRDVGRKLRTKKPSARSIGEEGDLCKPKGQPLPAVSYGCHELRCNAKGLSSVSHHAGGAGSALLHLPLAPCSWHRADVQPDSRGPAASPAHGEKGCWCVIRPLAHPRGAATGPRTPELCRGGPARKQQLPGVLPPAPPRLCVPRRPATAGRGGARTRARVSHRCLHAHGPPPEEEERGARIAAGPAPGPTQHTCAAPRARARAHRPRH